MYDLADSTNAAGSLRLHAATPTTMISTIRARATPDSERIVVFLLNKNVIDRLIEARSDPSNRTAWAGSHPRARPLWIDSHSRGTERGQRRLSRLRHELGAS